MSSRISVGFAQEFLTEILQRFVLAILLEFYLEVLQELLLKIVLVFVVEFLQMFFFFWESSRDSLWEFCRSPSVKCSPESLIEFLMHFLLGFLQDLRLVFIRNPKGFPTVNLPGVLSQSSLNVSLEVSLENLPGFFLLLVILQQVLFRTLLEFL